MDVKLQKVSLILLTIVAPKSLWSYQEKGGMDPPARNQKLLI